MATRNMTPLITPSAIAPAWEEAELESATIAAEVEVSGCGGCGGGWRTRSGGSDAGLDVEA